MKVWKLLKFKWQLKWGTETAFGEPNNKGQQMISTPPKVLLFLIYFLTVFIFIKELAFIIN